MAANWGTFDGANAMSASVMGVLGRDFLFTGSRLAVSGGIGVGFQTGGGDNVAGGRAGMQLTW